MSKSKLLHYSLLVTTLFLFTLSACKTNKATVNTPKPTEKSLLWEITGPEITKPSYLFGTIHMIDAKDFFLPKGTMTAIDNSKKIVFEIDMKEMSDMSKMMGMMGKLFMSDNKTLKDLLSEPDYELVGQHFKKLGIPIFMLERMKPMFLTVFASADMDPAGLQNGKMKSYEMEFLEMAKNANKETGGLETIDFQIGLFDEIPYEAQAKMLVDGIKSSDSDDGEYAKMTKMYLSQDINAMVNMISENDEISGFEDKVLTNRNKNWIPLIIEGAKKGPTFYAVGAGHLGGENGVISLLRKANITLKPIQ